MPETTIDYADEKKPEEKAADIHVAANHDREAVEACLADFKQMGTRPDKVAYYEALVAEYEKRGIRAEEK